MKSVNAKKWFAPSFDFDEGPSDVKKPKYQEKTSPSHSQSSSNSFDGVLNNTCVSHNYDVNAKDWMSNFDPIRVEDLAVHTKKVQEVCQWLTLFGTKNKGEILLLSGPVGAGKTATLRVLTKENGFRIKEWTTPIDLDVPNEYGEYLFREKQSEKFLDFLLKSANFTSLFDFDDTKAVVLVEDYPNIFLRNSSEFDNTLQQYKERGKAPLIFICSEASNESNSALSLFTNNLKEKHSIHHISFNAVSASGMKLALTRVSNIISKNYSSVYNIPNAELIDCVINTSAGDVRSAILNLHFASLKGKHIKASKQSIDKTAKVKKGNKKKNKAKKFVSLGKDNSVNILHGVGRVLNPKVSTENDCLSFVHAPNTIVDQFCTQPSSFLSFLQENYLPHFSSIDDAQKSAVLLSDADYFLSEWRDSVCQEYSLYVGVAGLMTSNKNPVSAWNPVRGPKFLKKLYPSTKDIPLLQENELHNGKTLISDYKTYCLIINENK